MEMSHDYLRETVEQMSEHGFVTATDTESVERGSAPPYMRTSYDLQRGESEHLCLEHLEYPDGSESYWLEVRRMGSITAFPFMLDSWKWREGQVEFSYYGRDDGSALTFVLHF